MRTLENPVEMAVIGAPHGVKGEVRVKTFTGDPMALGDYGPLQDEAGRIFTPAEVKPAKNVVVVRFKEVTSREAAEALNGTALFIDRSALPDDLEDEEFYHADLIGLRVEDETGAAIGAVIAVHDFGGGDILEIRQSARGTTMVPFTKAAVPAVDLRSGRLVVDPVAAGLKDDGGEEEDGASANVGEPAGSRGGQ